MCDIVVEKEPTRREFLREILYNNIAIIAIQHSKIYLDFRHASGKTRN